MPAQASWTLIPTPKASALVETSPTSHLPQLSTNYFLPWVAANEQPLATVTIDSFSACKVSFFLEALRQRSLYPCPSSWSLDLWPHHITCLSPAFFPQIFISLLHYIEIPRGHNKTTQVTQENYLISSVFCWSHVQSPFSHIRQQPRIPGIRM